MLNRLLPRRADNEFQGQALWLRLLSLMALGLVLSLWRRRAKAPTALEPM